MVRAQNVVARFLQAAPLEDVSKLRFQAVFLMGAGGSGKGFVGRKWMKYMPGAPSTGFEGDTETLKNEMADQERSLSNLSFEESVKALKSKGFDIELTKGAQAAKIPFQVYDYDQTGAEQLIPESEWQDKLPPDVYRQVQGLKEVIFSTPVHEIPSYWRQVNPDIYKKELAGYLDDKPGYVHEMSSEMAKAYFQAILKTGDPLFVDGTGSNPKKMTDQMKAAKAAGYNVSLVYVIVPLTVNQIRNATRPRNVNPSIVTKQWKAIQDSFSQVKGVADKSKVIINRNDPKDIATYKKDAEKINHFVATKTRYNSLYDLIAVEAPQELSDWGQLLQTGMVGDEDRRERFDRLEQKRRERGMDPREFRAAVQKAMAQE